MERGMAILVGVACVVGILVGTIYISEHVKVEKIPFTDSYILKK